MEQYLYLIQELVNCSSKLSIRVFGLVKSVSVSWQNGKLQEVAALIRCLPVEE
jgi:hypothetical protein